MATTASDVWLGTIFASITVLGKLAKPDLDLALTI